MSKTKKINPINPVRIPIESNISELEAYMVQMFDLIQKIKKFELKTNYGKAVPIDQELNPQ